MFATLVPKDIQDFLAQLAAAIELDQVWVEALPPERFSPAYSDSMWRAWRRDHRVFIDKLLSSADTMSPALLSELTGIATTYMPSLVGNVVLELFAEVVCGSCSQEDDLGTAEGFFTRLVKHFRDQSEDTPRHAGAKASILQWLPFTDPLRIGQDPECGYGQAYPTAERR